MQKLKILWSENTNYYIILDLTFVEVKYVPNIKMEKLSFQLEVFFPQKGIVDFSFVLHIILLLSFLLTLKSANPFLYSTA